MATARKKTGRKQSVIRQEVEQAAEDLLDRHRGEVGKEDMDLLLEEEVPLPAKLLHQICKAAVRRFYNDILRTARRKSPGGKIYCPFGKSVEYKETKDGVTKKVTVVSLPDGPTVLQNHAFEQNAGRLIDSNRSFATNVDVTNELRAKKGIKPYVIPKREIAQALNEINRVPPPE